MLSSGANGVISDRTNKLLANLKRAATDRKKNAPSNSPVDVPANPPADIPASAPSKVQVNPPVSAPVDSPVNVPAEKPKLTPKRRASIVIVKRAQATKSQPDRLKRGEIIKVNGVDYKIDKDIGSGGSCVVYRAVQMKKNGQQVALKIVDLSNANSELTKIFENEIQFLEQLQGSNYVIEMIDHQRIQDKLLVVMELGERNFKEQMKIYKENRRLDEHTLKFVWSQMLQCVNVIHKLNIVHADLKPANFVLVNGMIKLIDFGIAAQIVTDENSVYRKGVQGTLNYISPEAVNTRPEGDGYEIPLKSDVWSLGCMLYALVYGEPPFAHIERQEKKLLAILHDPIKFPKQKINPMLADVLKRCLTRDISERPTVEQLLRHPYLTNSV